MKYTAESPYGYWISKNEIIPVIQEESHAEAALEILGREFENTSIYAVMFRLGYVRVVNFPDGCGVEYWQYARLSKLQKQFIGSAEYVDKVNHIGRNTREKYGYVYMQ